jgi:serine/threonine protein kinase
LRGRVLDSGKTPGPYKILSVLGKGGMGAFYRANDPRLHGEVAIKVSGESFSDRFERDARRRLAELPKRLHAVRYRSNYLVIELIECGMLSLHRRSGSSNNRPTPFSIVVAMRGSGWRLPE